MKSEISPPENTKVNFRAATAFVRNYRLFKKPIKFTSRDRGVRIRLDSGFIIIEQRWQSIGENVVPLHSRQKNIEGDEK